MEALIGERIIAWRRRRGGMTQTALAGLAGLSQPYISQIESGHKPLDRKSTQVAIAAALNISVAQLLGEQHSADDPLRARAAAHVPAIRAALVELSAGERRTPTRTADQVAAAVTRLTDLRNEADYAGVADILPDLLYDLYGHGTAMAPAMVEVLFGTRYALKTMGYPDLALTASQIGAQVARDHDDPAWRGQAVYSMVQAYPIESAALGATVATRAANDLATSSDRGAQEVYGCLHLLAGMLEAVAGRADDAATHLDESASIAARLGEPAPYSTMSAGFNGNWYGPTQVEYWRMAVAAELGDPGEARRIADRIDLAAVPVPNRWVYYWTDLARALAAGSRDEDAMMALVRAERAAPQHFRWNPITRELVAMLVARAKRRAVTRDMRMLAGKLGIDPL